MRYFGPSQTSPRKWLLAVKDFTRKFHHEHAHLAFNCLKLTIETLEQGIKYVQSSNKDTQTTTIASFWCLFGKL